MPPLLDVENQKTSKKNTTLIGESCESCVISLLTLQGHNVSRPLVDSGVDLIVVKDGKYLKCQVKKVVRDKRGSYRFFFYKRNSNYEDIDIFYHVILTPLRQLIFETPGDMIPPGGRQVDLFLDRDCRQGKVSWFSPSDRLVSYLLSPQLHQRA